MRFGWDESWPALKHGNEKVDGCVAVLIPDHKNFRVVANNTCDATDVDIEVVLGDITKQDVDVVVNAANSSLLGGGGVDGAIHRAAGPDLVHACRLLGGCKTGDAKITKGFRLSARWIVHTVGPVWRGGNDGEQNLLASCYLRSLEEAVKVSAHSIAFPSISNGIFGYPIDLASEVAITTLRTFEGDLNVRLVAYSQEHFDVIDGIVGARSKSKLE
jgi:O-acetyl-ADP-ribose deacetylase